MRFELVFLNTVDPLLGRLDYASLSEQAVMEMVIEGITNKEKIRGDIEEWKGVAIEEGEVVAIGWRQFKLEGSLHLEWLPSSVREFDATGNHLTADPMEGHLFVVGQDQYTSMGRFRKPPLVAMGGPGSSWWRDERMSTNSL